MEFIEINGAAYRKSALVYITDVEIWGSKYQFFIGGVGGIDIAIAKDTYAKAKAARDVILQQLEGPQTHVGLQAIREALEAQAQLKILND